ncbi:MAG: hypothetical protein LBG80_20540 [Bacteroidales bacterium]|jgi:hypothetical protein|nr:hypothetical protein [Bacteroidales bacterium]
MASNPKLEFYKFSLKHTDDNRKTFRDFAIEELNGDASMSNDNIFELCFRHFVKQFTEGHAKNKNKQKTITFISDESKNPYVKYYPTLNKAKNTLSGVINGGPYDKEAIVSDTTNNENNSTLGKNMSILLPYFIFAYFPSDHFEGFFIVHSYNRADSITDVFRSYVTELFKGNNYNKAIPMPFCPKNFQEEWRKGAVIQDMIFSTAVIDNQLSNNPISNNFNEYNVEIKITPKVAKDKNKPQMQSINNIWDIFKAKGYSKGSDVIKIEDFEKQKIVAKNEERKTTKTFQWNSTENEFVPVIYLRDVGVAVSENGIPDFEQLKIYCTSLFDSEILKEIRPDKNVHKNI